MLVCAYAPKTGHNRYGICDIEILFYLVVVGSAEFRAISSNPGYREPI